MQQHQPDAERKFLRQFVRYQRARVLLEAALLVASGSFQAGIGGAYSGGAKIDGDCGLMLRHETSASARPRSSARSVGIGCAPEQPQRLRQRQVFESWLWRWRWFNQIIVREQNVIVVVLLADRSSFRFTPFCSQIDRRPPDWFIDRVVAVEEIQHLDTEIYRIQQTAVVFVESRAVGGIRHLLRQRARFEQRLAEAIDQIMNEREAVVRKGALFFEDEARPQHRVAQLIAPVQSDVIRPDSGERARAELVA